MTENAAERPFTTGIIAANATTAVMTAGAIVENALEMPSSTSSGITDFMAEPMAVTASFTSPMTVAMAVPMPENVPENAFIAPDMFSAPIASITTWMAFATRFCTFSIAVPMPCVESLACCENDANPSTPSLSSATTAWLNPSIVTVPALRALYRSFDVASAPSMAFATWLSCPGMTSCSVFQS